MTFFPGTEIPCRILSKSELAQLLRIHVSTLSRWRRRCEPYLQEIPGYNRNSHLLTPACIEVILRQNGVILEKPFNASQQA